MNWHITAPRDIAHLPRVTLRQFEWNVTADRSNAEQVQFVGRRERQEQGDSVVLPGIAVNYNFS